MPRFKSFFKVLPCLFLLSSFAHAQSRAIKINRGSVDKCRLAKTGYLYPDDGSRFATTFEVDKQSRLVKEITNYKHGGGKRDNERITTNTYDAEGFLTERVAITTSAEPNDYSEKSNVEKFTYTDGRLQIIETSITYEAPSRDANYRTENKYDASGGLSERIFTSNGNVVRYNYANGTVTGISDPHINYILIDKGSVTKKTMAAGVYTVYNYNVKQQPVNEITFNGKGEKVREDTP